MQDIALKRENLALFMLIRRKEEKVKRREELRNVELLKEEKEVVAEPKKEDTASVNSNILLKYNFL